MSRESKRSEATPAPGASEATRFRPTKQFAGPDPGPVMFSAGEITGETQATESLA